MHKLCVGSGKRCTPDCGFTNCVWQKKMKLLDLFSGIGGFSLAARWAGIDTAAFCEIDKFCQKVLQKNFPGVPIHDDIKELHCFPYVDIITAGLPCQPFSVAGKRKGREDSRYLWPELLRIIEIVKPKFVVIENVVGIVALELENILVDLERANYFTLPIIIPACAANAPHRRDRVWIIANRHSERWDVRSDTYQGGFIQSDKKPEPTALQQKWDQFKPQSWKTFKVADLLANPNRLSSIEAGSSSFPLEGTEKTRMGHPGQDRRTSTGDGGKIHIPAVCRMDDGISRKLDTNRIKALGNSIVPQIAYPILAGIKNL